MYFRYISVSPFYIYIAANFMYFLVSLFPFNIFNAILTFFFLIQFYIPFKIISAHIDIYIKSLTVGGAKTGEPREKPPDTPASRTWLVSHVARAGLEPTPVTAVR